VHAGSVFVRDLIKCSKLLSISLRGIPDWVIKIKVKVRSENQRVSVHWVICGQGDGFRFLGLCVRCFSGRSTYLIQVLSGTPMPLGLLLELYPPGFPRPCETLSL
jgi:hypothetical protein